MSRRVVVTGMGLAAGAALESSAKSRAMRSATTLIISQARAPTAKARTASCRMRSKTPA